METRRAADTAPVYSRDVISEGGSEGYFVLLRVDMNDVEMFPRTVQSSIGVERTLLIIGAAQSPAVDGSNVFTACGL